MLLFIRQIVIELRGYVGKEVVPQYNRYSYEQFSIETPLGKDAIDVGSIAR